MNLDVQRLGRVGVALFLLAVIAAGVRSNVDRGTAAPGWTGFAIVAVAGAAVLGSVLVFLWVSGNAAFAGTSVWEKAATSVAIGAAGLAVFVVLVVLSPLGPERPWVAPERPCVDGAFFWQHFPSRREELWSHPERFCWPSGAGATGGSVGGGSTELSRTLIAAVAGSAVVLLLAGAVLLALAVRRSRRGTPSADDEDAAVIQALDESLDDLRRERDVRRAIVACYARMERALAGAGRGRQAHETPLEFLRRVLERVATEPGQVLTELFERARFSVEPLGESEKRSAIAALEQLRARVAG